MKQATLDMFLDRLDPTNRSDQLGFLRILDALGLGAAEEISARTQRVSCPAGLRQLTVEFIYYHPEPDWAPVMDRIIRHEKDLAIFATGVRALGRMGTEEALRMLKALGTSRATPAFRDLVDQVLQKADPREAFNHHFTRLLQGSAQATDANEGAHHLAGLLTPDSLQPLGLAVQHPDPLIFRQALRLIGLIPSEGAAAFLLEYLQDAHQEALENREVRNHLAAMRSLSRSEVLDRCLQAVAELKPELAAPLASGSQDQAFTVLDTLRAPDPGWHMTFLLDTILAAREEKPAALARYLEQAGVEAQKRMRRLEYGVDTAAHGLAHLVELGLVPPGEVLESFTPALRHHTGRTGLVSALAQLVDPEDTPRIKLLLDEQDGALRGAALEVLGRRRNPALRSALLHVRRDPISDLALRSLWHLGQLPDPVSTARNFLDQSDPEEILVGLRFISVNGLSELLPELLERLDREGPDRLQMAVLETLAAIRSPDSVSPLLTMLHSGQGPRLQVALAETLRDLALPEAALGLCGRAMELKQPILHTLAVEAFARAHDSPNRPLPASRGAAVLAALKGGWGGRGDWGLRRRMGEALLGMCLDQPHFWTNVSECFQEALAEKRAPGEISQEDLTRIQNLSRSLAQRAQVPA